MHSLLCVLLNCCFFGVSCRSDYTSSALQDEIHNLPRAPSVQFRMFSGYIDVSNDDEETGTRQMFYWFVESESSPDVDPVILWTNGGPGCSGLGGFLTEQGPFRAGPNKSLLLNEHSWNKVANMVFIEQPVGVGFSMVNKNISYGDAQAAQDNLRFISNFFKRFSNYRRQTFYIASESYGGHYLPTLAKTFWSTDGEHLSLHFKGIFLGNPLTYMPYRNYGQYGTAWGHQLLPKPLWDMYETAGCKSSFPVSQECAEITQEMDDVLEAFDPYALDFPTCQTSLSAGRHERWTLRHAIRRAQNPSSKLQDTVYQPCAEDLATAYLNSADVKAAIHVKSSAEWSLCSNIDYSSDDVNSPMMPVWDWLLHHSTMKMMIYSGDDDSVCATLGTQQFIWDLGLQPKSNASWTPWKIDDQIAGFITAFARKGVDGLYVDGRFSFATVHGAGHMVPATQPVRSLQLLKNFLADDGMDHHVVESHI